MVRKKIVLPYFIFILTLFVTSSFRKFFHCSPSSSKEWKPLSVLLSSQWVYDVPCCFWRYTVPNYLSLAISDICDVCVNRRDGSVIWCSGTVRIFAKKHNLRRFGVLCEVNEIYWDTVQTFSRIIIQIFSDGIVWLIWNIKQQNRKRFLCGSHRARRESIFDLNGNTVYRISVWKF